MKVVSLITILTTAVLAAYGFMQWGAAGLPFPDATADQLASQQRTLRFWGVVTVMSLLIFAVGIFGFWKSSRARKGRAHASD